jgi:hypothetical protein
MAIDQLPPRKQGAADTNKAERRFYAGLGASDYLKFEIEAMERGITPYLLVKYLLTQYVNHELVVVDELPEDTQQAIKVFYQDEKRA